MCVANYGHYSELGIGFHHVNFQGALQVERKYNTSMSVHNQSELLSSSHVDLARSNLPKGTILLKRTS